MAAASRRSSALAGGSGDDQGAPTHLRRSLGHFPHAPGAKDNARCGGELEAHAAYQSSSWGNRLEYKIRVRGSTSMSGTFASQAL